MESKLIELQERLIDKYLTPDNKSQRTGKITGYNCLFCDSGTGRNGTGITFKKSNSDSDKLIFTCFKCGSIKGDTIFDIVIKRENIQGNNKEQFKQLFEIAGLETDKKTYKKEVSEQTKQKIKQYQAKQEEEEKKQVEVYKQLFNKATANKEKAIDYLAEDRGINKEYANSLQNIGFYNLTSAIAKQIKAPISFIDKDKSKNDLIIIKIKDNFYIQRFTNRATNSKYKYLNATGLHSTIYNEDVLLNNSGIVFVVEGLFDCLSIESIGYKAIALNSTSNADKLIEYIKANRLNIKNDLQIVLLCDNDKNGAGTKANETLLKALEEDLNIKAYITGIFEIERVKDMNELLLKGKETAKQRIDNVIESIKAEKTKDKDLKIEFKDRENKSINIKSDYEYIDSYYNHIEQKQREHITTGLKQLDNAINRGLTTGLYIIGAKAGTGKTAFLLQISDYIAKNSNKLVLFFSLEQSKNALFNRKIARISFEYLKKEYIQNNLLENGMIHKEKIEQLPEFKDIEFYGEQLSNKANEQKNRQIYRAIETYREKIAKNVYTIDNVYTVEDIKKIVEQCIKQGKKPIVFIDYLQRLKPSKEKTGRIEDKQLIDDSIAGIKELIVKYGLIVFLVSSFNRQAEETELKAFNGSNEIEYNAEFAGTLQVDFSCLFNEKELESFNKISKKRRTQKLNQFFMENRYKPMILNIIKQKDGISGIEIKLRSYSANYYFEEVEETSNKPKEKEDKNSSFEDIM